MSRLLSASLFVALLMLSGSSQADTRSAKMRIGGAIITSVGGAAAIAGAITLGVGLSQEADARALFGCEGDECPPEAEADITDAQDNQAGGAVALVVGGVSLAIGIPFWIVGSLGDGSSSLPAVRVFYADRVTLSWAF